MPEQRVLSFSLVLPLSRQLRTGTTAEPDAIARGDANHTGIGGARNGCHYRLFCSGFLAVDGLGLLLRGR